MEKIIPNGRDIYNDTCKFNSFIDDFEVVKKQLIDSNDNMKMLLENVRYLKKLSALDDIKDNLLNAATGSDRVPLNVVIKLIRVMGAMNAGLMGTIIFLLVGNHFSWWSLH